MYGQEYLNQISADNRPAKQSKMGNLLSSKFFLVGAIGLALLIVIIIIGAILSGNKGGEKNNSFRLILHIDNTAKIIEEYQPYVKSSELRASSSSLSGVLARTSSELTGYLQAKYDYKEKNIDKDIAEEAQLKVDGLDYELMNAKINGILDRIYAHKMASEISTIMAEEAKIQNSTKSSDLEELLGTSYTSLENLYDKFNDFSETK